LCTQKNTPNKLSLLKSKATNHLIQPSTQLCGHDPSQASTPGFNAPAPKASMRDFRASHARQSRFEAYYLGEKIKTKKETDGCCGSSRAAAFSSSRAPPCLILRAGPSEAAMEGGVTGSSTCVAKSANSVVGSVGCVAGSQQIPVLTAYDCFTSRRPFLCAPLLASHTAVRAAASAVSHSHRGALPVTTRCKS
jgi:hypothetical protein